MNHPERRAAPRRRGPLRRGHARRIWRSTRTRAVIASGTPVLLAACYSATTPEPPEGIDFLVERFEVVHEDVESASFAVASLHVQLAMVNTRPDSLVLEYGSCALSLEGAGEGLWRSDRARSWPGSTGFGCLGYLAMSRMGPGDTLRPRELERDFRLATILADSLPAGPYDFHADLGLGDFVSRVELGRIVLPESRYPIPEDRAFRDGFRYGVEIGAPGSAAPRALTVRLEVSHVAPTESRLERDVSADCPVQLLGYESADDRVTIPLPAPAWRWPASCGPSTQPVELGPDEAIELERALPLDELLAAGATPGRYHLLGVIEVDGRRMRVLAGAIEVTSADG